MSLANVPPAVPFHSALTEAFVSFRTASAPIVTLFSWKLPELTAKAPWNAALKFNTLLPNVRELNATATVPAPEALKFSAALSSLPLIVNTEPAANSTVFPLARALAAVTVACSPKIREPADQVILSTVKAAYSPEARFRIPPSSVIMPIPV